LQLFTMPLRMGVGVATPLPDVEVLLAVTRVEGVG
jgi:hypothetical protein